MLVFSYSFFFFIINLFFCIKCYESDDSSIISFDKTPDEISYLSGSSVSLTCKLKLIEGKKIVLFRKDKNMKSEACHVFDSTRYSMDCTNVEENGVKMKEYKFTIKQVSWDDRGKWDCLYAQNNKFIEIDVRVEAIFYSLQVRNITPVKQDKESVEDTKTLKNKLFGRGSRTNPYNLRDGSTVNMTCLSSCSYPQTTHKWFYKNLTHAPNEIKGSNQKKRDICASDKEKGMIASESEVVINCSTLKMVGSILVMCSSSGDMQSRNSSAYILCPGGEREWELTTGEMVGVAVSVLIFVLLTMFISLLVKRSRYSNVPGDDGVKTYSSGVKV